MEIVETPIFTRLIREALPDTDYRLLQWALVANPELGKLIPGGAGIRKCRWGARGQGKRGGLRVIYFWDTPGERIYMLYVYSKSEAGDLSQAQVRVLAKLVREGLQ